MESTIHPTHVEVRPTAQDIDDLICALDTYVGEYEAVDPDDDIGRARVLTRHLRTIRAALP